MYGIHVYTVTKLKHYNQDHSELLLGIPLKIKMNGQVCTLSLSNDAI